MALCFAIRQYFQLENKNESNNIQKYCGFPDNSVWRKMGKLLKFVAMSDGYFQFVMKRCIYSKPSCLYNENMCKFQTFLPPSWIWLLFHPWATRCQTLTAKFCSIPNTEQSQMIFLSFISFQMKLSFKVFPSWPYIVTMLICKLIL